MILNTDAGGTQKGSSVFLLFSVSPIGLSVWVIYHMIGLYWSHWTKRIDGEGSFSAIFSTDYNCLWWVIENQKLRFRSGFSLLRVVKCLLMPRSGEPSPVPEMNTHPLIFFDLKHLSVVRLRHTWLLNPRLFQLHLTWLPPFDYSALTWSWGHQRKEGEITCSCSNLGFHLMGLRLPLFSPAKLIRSLVLILLYSVALSVLSPTASVSVKFKCRTWEQRCPSVV